MITHVTLSFCVISFKFDVHMNQCLRPVGEYNLRLGIMKELAPELVATHSTKSVMTGCCALCDSCCCAHHCTAPQSLLFTGRRCMKDTHLWSRQPLQSVVPKRSRYVEIRLLCLIPGLSTTVPVPCLVWLQGIKVFRFANRIPLLFEAGSDVGTVVATKKIKCV